jgi:hypothetical protein
LLRLPAPIVGSIVAGVALLAISVWNMDVVGCLGAVALLTFQGILIVVGWRREWWIEGWWKKY